MSGVGNVGYLDAFLPGLMFAGALLAVLPWLDRKNALIRSVLLILCAYLAWNYMSWRIVHTTPLDGPLIDRVTGILFTSVEALALIGSTLSMLFLTRTSNRTPQADENVEWMRANGVAPRIDVLICTYNEDQQILERTIVGATSIEYDNYRVWVCDDGRRDWLRDMCKLYDVGYLTRPDNKHAKAGNINAALEKLAALPEKPEFVAILDADFVPLPTFLTRTVALMRDDDVGVVQSPQHFFNPDPVQNNLSLAKVWPDEQRFFFDIIMPAKDAWNAAFCCGTSSLLRFDALLRVGGFPTESVTEDYLVSLKLRQSGYKTVYLNEVLSLGLAPEGLVEYCTQRSRWCLGFVQIVRSQSGPLRLGNGLPLADRIILLETFLHWSATHMFRLLGIVIPSLYLLFGVQAVHTTVTDVITHLFPYFVAQSLVYYWLTQGRVLPILADLYQLLAAHEVVKAVFQGLVRPKKQRFKVTAKGGDRSGRFIQWPMLRIFLGLAIFVGLGIVSSFLFNKSSSVSEASAIALFWSWYNLVILTLACYVCVEERRSGNRFPWSAQVNVSGHIFKTADISISGVRLVGDPPSTVGGAVSVELGGAQVEARVIRLTNDGFALEFDPDPFNRARVIRYLFSGRFNPGIPVIRPFVVMLQIGRRIMR